MKQSLNAHNTIGLDVCFSIIRIYAFKFSKMQRCVKLLDLLSFILELPILCKPISALGLLACVSRLVITTFSCHSELFLLWF